MTRARRVGGEGRRAGDAQGVRSRFTRRRLPQRGVPIAVNLAPMIDVTFLLLIFFLVTSTFERAEGILASRLPEVVPAPAVPLPISPIVIRITQLGPGHDDFRLHVDRFEDGPESLDALPDFLRQLQRQPGFDKQTPVVIVAQDDVRWDHVVSCFNAALRAGCQRVAFGEP